MFDLINNILIIVVGIYAFLTYLMIKRGKNKKISISYSFVLVSVIFWTTSMILYRSSTPESSVFFVKLLYVTASFTASTFYIFSHIFPKGNFPSITKNLVSILLNIAIIILIIYPNIIIVDVLSPPGSEKVIIWGTWYFLFVLYIVGFFSCGLISLLRKFLKSVGIEKLQILYVFLGYLLGSTFAMFTNLFMVWWGDFRFNWLGQVFSLIMVGFTVYTIIRFRLLGIKLLMSKIYIFFILSVCIYTLFQLLILVHNTMLFANINNVEVIAIEYLIAIFTAIALLPIINYLQKSSEYLFFRGQNHSGIIKLLSTKLSGIIDIKQVISIIDSELKKIVGADDVRIVYTSAKSKNNFKNEAHVELYVAKKTGLKREAIPSNNEIFAHIIKHKSVIVQGEVEQSNVDKKLLKELKNYNAQIVAPMIARKRIIGAIILDQKVTQNAYTKEDIDYIEIISSQAAIAIDNARLYKEIKDFNTRLKQEVARATKNLQATNDELKTVNEKLVVAYEKLHKLDRAKSEFLSIASHQLRTPLTSIKGFTSLILEGTYGKVSKDVRKVLEKVFLSNERLIRLVEDLLNITRIESGKFVFELKKQDITALVKEVIESFSVPAKTKDIKINLKITGRKTPKFYFDKNKIREVLSNFIDNSLKYSEKGPIDVEISNKKDLIRITVSDKGLGIPKGELDYIFDKFQRGKGVNQVHTEGVGLGLYVCKKIIEAHKGKIWAESDGLGKGSSFIFELQKKVTPKDLAK